MDKMDQFSSEDAISYRTEGDIEEDLKEAKKRLSVWKLYIENAMTIDNLDDEETFFYQLCHHWWSKLSRKQKTVAFYHIVQNLSVKQIAKALNRDRSTIYRVLNNALEKSRSLFSRVK